MKGLLAERIARVTKLAEFIAEGSPTAAMRKRADGTFWFDHHVSGRDGASLNVDPASNMVTVYSWLESGHNGDHYDCKTTILEPKQAYEELTRLESRLRAEATQQVKRRIVAERERRDDMEAAETVNRLLGSG